MPSFVPPAEAAWFPSSIPLVTAGGRCRSHHRPFPSRGAGRGLPFDAVGQGSPHATDLSAARRRLAGVGHGMGRPPRARRGRAGIGAGHGHAARPDARRLGPVGATVRSVPRGDQGRQARGRQVSVGLSDELQRLPAHLPQRLLLRASRPARRERHPDREPRHADGGSPDSAEDARRPPPPPRRPGTSRRTSPRRNSPTCSAGPTSRTPSGTGSSTLASRWARRTPTPAGPTRTCPASSSASKWTA